MSQDEIKVLFAEACNNYELFLTNIGGQDMADAPIEVTEYPAEHFALN